MRRYLTLNEAVNYTRLRKETVANAVDCGELPRVVEDDEAVILDRIDVQNWMRRRKTYAHSWPFYAGEFVFIDQDEHKAIWGAVKVRFPGWSDDRLMREYREMDLWCSSRKSEVRPKAGWVDFAYNWIAKKYAVHDDVRNE